MANDDVLKRLSELLKIALPTSRHAEVLMDAVQGGLGNDAHRATSDDGGRVDVNHRDPA